MPIDPEALATLLRHRAMNRLEAGARAGADWLCNVLKASVSRPTVEMGQRAAEGPHIFEWHPEAWKNPPAGRGDYSYGSPLRRTIRRGGVVVERSGDPPYMRTGAGRDSIGFQIIERNDEEGRLVLGIGVDASARDAAHPYMLFHELGISYPTKQRTDRPAVRGPKLRRPWLRPGIRRYWSDFAAIVVGHARGLL